MVDYATMPDVPRIHQRRQPIRRHYLGDWLEALNLTPVDLLNALNDPERSMEFGEIDKSQVYRWLKGQLPQAAQQERIAKALHMDDPATLLRHPDDGWFRDFTEGRPADEVSRIKQMLEVAFPPKRA